jgi:hypothetical protein
MIISYTSDIDIQRFDLNYNKGTNASSNTLRVRGVLQARSTAVHPSQHDDDSFSYHRGASHECPGQSRASLYSMAASFRAPMLFQPHYRYYAATIFELC